MYIDLITKIKNSQQAKKETLKVPYSKMNESLVKLLAKNGYVGDVEKKGRSYKKFLEINLRYVDGEGAIKGIKFISKPSRHLYYRSTDIRSVKRGYGMLLISTSKGIMDGKSAKKEKVGGEALFEIW